MFEVVAVFLTLIFNKYCSDAFEAWWDIILLLCHKFIAKSVSERIFNIGQHLAKLEAKIQWHSFAGHGVHKTHISGRVPRCAAAASQKSSACWMFPPTICDWHVGSCAIIEHSLKSARRSTMAFCKYFLLTKMLGHLGSMDRREIQSITESRQPRTKFVSD